AAIRSPTLPELLLRVQVARDRGRIDEAVALLGPLREGGDPGESAMLASTLGTLELLRQRFRAAEAALTRAVALDPTRGEARRELINLYAAQGRLADAEIQFRALERASESHPLEFADLYLWTVGRREDLGPAELAEALTRAVSHDPADRHSRLALAENLRRLGRLDDAQAALEPLTGLDAEARALRVRLALDRGEVERAGTMLAETPADLADAPAIARLRGRLALVKGDASAAIHAYRIALREAPDDRDARFGLAQALRLAGEAASARPLADSVQARDRLDWLVQNARPPDRRGDPATLRAIGDACLALGRREQARAWYRLALARDPLNGDLQRALFRLSGPGDDSRPE
ncbi:MAG: tetratricopeptide repeat protein, partial [Isosphaeraceae bacterium]